MPVPTATSDPPPPASPISRSPPLEDLDGARRGGEPHATRGRRSSRSVGRGRLRRLGRPPRLRGGERLVPGRVVGFMGDRDILERRRGPPPRPPGGGGLWRGSGGPRRVLFRLHH